MACSATGEELGKNFPHQRYHSPRELQVAHKYSSATSIEIKSWDKKPRLSTILLHLQRPIARNHQSRNFKGLQKQPKQLFPSIGNIKPAN